MKVTSRILSVVFAAALYVGLSVPVATVFALAAVSTSHAAVVSNIEVRGNHRVDSATIRNYLSIKPGKPFSSGDIDAAVKRLFSTGLFSDVQINQAGGTLIIQVSEYATVNQVIVISGQTGEMVPLYCTAHGKALLTDMEEPELRRLFGQAALRRHTKQTLRSIGELAEDCAQARARGFATDDSELQEGVRCVAAPIRAHDGTVIGSIGISAPSLRFPKERYKNCGAEVADTAGRITAELAAQITAS